MSKAEHHRDIEDNVRKAFSVIRKYSTVIKNEAESQLAKISFCSFNLSDDIPDTIAIDGSYAPIFRSASMWVVAVRAAALTYKFSQSQSGPAYDVRDCEINEGAELVTTSRRIAEELPAFSRELTELTAARKSEAPKRMAAYARILREFQLANFVAKDHHDSLILMDGTLTTPPVSQIDRLAEETLQACDENGNTLIGVSKDSNTNLLGSVATDEELLRGVDRKELFYVKAPEPRKTLLGPRGDIYFVKLHPEAPKWFRIDVASATQEPEELFGAIAQFARNQLCLGYPFPLVEAHMMAVELRKYPKLYDELLFKVGQEMGFSLEEIVWGRTDVEGRRLDAFHAYLDLLAKRGVTQ